MATETTFFEGGNLTVTNARFIVGTQTFAMRGVTSVQGVEIPANYTASGLLILLGACVALTAFLNSAIGFGIFGVLLSAGGIWAACRQKPTYAVVLRTAGGEVTAYESKDRDYISQVIEALNQSIISHA